MNLKNKLKKLPDCPGVYLMKGENGEVIYVGKASSLKKRVSSYFHSSGNNTKTLVLTSKIYDFEVIPVASEAEALVLENKLIKEYQPKYNTNLKDGKSYPFLKITSDKFPSIQIVREEKDNKSLYFGPFTNKKLLKDTVRFLRKFYPVRNCKKNIERGNVKLCTQYYIGRCSGPCEGKITEEEYRKLVEGIIAFFEGKYKEFEKKLRKWMVEAIKTLDFEKANELKKRLFMLKAMEEKFPLRDEETLTAYSEKNELIKLSEVLNLEKIPYHIEGYDVSNISGYLAVGSKVSFKGGVPDKENYRRYRIKTVSGIDDYKMLEEVLRRRFSSEEEKEIPDLILIDGGKGQLSVAKKVLSEFKLNIPVISLAKQNEEIFSDKLKFPLKLPEGSPELSILQRVRNEAHRFAISYHKNLRKKAVKLSFLDEIKGVGEKTKKKLLTHFQNLSELKKVNIEELKKIGISEKIANKLLHEIGKHKIRRDNLTR